MEIRIDLFSSSVTYEDINASPRKRRMRKRVGNRGPKIRRPLPQDPLSKLSRKRKNIRNGIKKRLDGIKFRTIDPTMIGKTRQELRVMFQEFKRIDARLNRMKKPKLKRQ